MEDNAKHIVKQKMVKLWQKEVLKTHFRAKNFIRNIELM